MKHGLPYRASEKYYKKTLVYNPRRRAQEFLGRFQKGLPGRAPRLPRGVKLGIAITSRGTKLDPSLFLFLICERFVDGVLVSVHEAVTSIAVSILASLNAPGIF